MTITLSLMLPYIVSVLGNDCIFCHLTKVILQHPLLLTDVLSLSSQPPDQAPLI